MSRIPAILRVLAGRDVDRLTALRESIQEWIGRQQRDLAAHAESRESKEMDEEEESWLSEQRADEACMIAETERLLYAGLAVAIMSTTETFTRRVCTTAGVQLLDKKGKPQKRPNWGHYRTGLERKLDTDFASMPGFPGCSRARILGNCFKHNGGRANDEYVKEYPGSLGDEIEYEKENWPDLIEATRTFLRGLTGKL